LSDARSTLEKHGIKKQDFYKEKADEQENDLDEIFVDFTPYQPLPAEIDPQDLQEDIGKFDEWQSELRKCCRRD